MARIRHIAMTTKEPAKVAEFYKAAFGLKELRRSPNGAVFLTDGHINIAILNHKTEKSADVGAHGPNFNGIHHFGFEVDDLDAACEKLGGGPGGVVTDISHPGGEAPHCFSDPGARGEGRARPAGIAVKMGGGGKPPLRSTPKYARH